MIPFNLTFIGEKDPPPWKGEHLDCGVLEDVNILDKGLGSGLPSVAFRMKLPGNQPFYTVAQQTARNVVTLAHAILGKYPALMSDDIKTTSMIEMVMALHAKPQLDVLVLSRPQWEQLVKEIEELRRK